MGAESLQYGTMIVGLLGGLAVFLFGMEQMTAGLKAAAGGRMKSLLARMTRNRLRALFAGAFTTAVIQSSTVTTVLAIGFVHSGLMGLPQAIGIVMGASIGTTVTAQIIAFKVTNFALVAIAVGMALHMLAKSELPQRFGTMLLGLGLVFLGMNLMGEAMAPLRDWPPFTEAIASYSMPLLAVLLGAVFTALIQSSSATSGLIIVFAAQGMISLEVALALGLGANLGTTGTALLAAIGKRPEAIQTALAYLVFKLAGVVIWLLLLVPLADFMRWLIVPHPELEGLAKLAAETPRQFASGYMLLNVVNALALVWFTEPLARFVRWLAPGRPGAEPEMVQPKYLDEALLETPALALDRVRMELGHLGERVLKMLGRAPRPRHLEGGVEAIAGGRRALHRRPLQFRRRRLSRSRAHGRVGPFGPRRRPQSDDGGPGHRPVARRRGRGAGRRGARLSHLRPGHIALFDAARRDQAGRRLSRGIRDSVEGKANSE